MKNKIRKLSKKIGNTKTVRLYNIEKKYNLNIHLYAKIESTNLTGSIKDRPVFEIVKNMVENGIINDQSILIEATSGNVGISLSYIGKELGIPVVIVMPSSMSKQRREMINKNEAELILIDGTMTDCVNYVNELINKDSRYLSLKQFENPICVKAHFEHTGVEIYKDIKDIDCLVCGIGTSGTIIGCSKYLKGKNSNIKVVGVEPYSSPFINRHIAGKHKIEGIGAGFIPSLYEPKYVDEVEEVKDDDAYKKAKELYKEEHIFCGVSSGAALAGALQYVSKHNEIKNVVIILPDSGDRYTWD
ncbi:MAG: PLP-dependent cysteine synthase family protein [Bacilli bacterium]